MLLELKVQIIYVKKKICQDFNTNFWNRQNVEQGIEIIFSQCIL